MRTRRKCRGSCGGSTKVVSAKLNSRASACIAPSASPRASGNTASWFPPNACSVRSEEHTSELQSHSELVCRLRLEKKKFLKFDGNNEAAHLGIAQLLNDHMDRFGRFFFLMIPRLPRSTLFPYTTLFR